MPVDAQDSVLPSGQHGGIAEEPIDTDLSDARCRALVHVLTSIIWVTDANGHCLGPQTAWERYTGQAWAQHAGLGWLNAIHPDDRDEVCRSFEQARRHGKPYFCRGRLWHRPSQAYRQFEVRGVPIADHHGRVLEWIGTCKDVEEQHRAEIVLREADRRKDEFIAILAHELRNPLAPIRNAVHVLKRRSGQDLQLAWVCNIVERQVGQMAHLLDDLLDVSRITQNKVELSKSRVTLDSVLEMAIETSRPLLEEYGHVLELAVLQAPVYIDADPKRLAQAFANLLTNAAKYTDRGGRIILAVRLVGSVVRVSITDNGIGIAPENLDRVFELFTQAPASQDRSLGGLGIGLSIVRSLVEMHGGQVAVTSAGLGRGCEFSVTLPAAHARVSPQLPQASSDAAGRSLNVLVADDNPDAADTLAVLIELLGHQVTVALDRQQALDAAQGQSFHVAFLDIGMPRKNGYEVAEFLSRSCPSTRIVAITGWGQARDLERAVEAGFERHLVKPVAPDEVERLLALLAEDANFSADTKV